MKIALFISCFIVFGLNAQTAPTVVSDTTKTDTVVKRTRYVVKIGYEIEGTDTVPVYLLNKFHFNAEDSKSKEEMEAFKKLHRWVKKALPYAKLAAFRLQMMEDNLNLLTTERAKKKYIKACEKSIKKQFMDDLKNMYVEEGKILLKLIHRETGKTTFEIMKNYGGTFETVFWQAMAKTYHASMKVTYDPVLDYQIEEIIKSLEIENAPKD
ncbi:MAG: DUF4294 domain-containing protein [Bacteroidia bacterium]